VRRTKKTPVRISRGLDARKQMLEGIAEMTRAVAATYGPRGRTVMLDRPGGILSTKDGVSVAWEIEPADPVRRLGTRVVQEACGSVNRACGDGTTTTAILVHAILRESLKWIAAGAHPVLLARDLQRVADDLVEADMFDVCCPVAVEDEGLMREVALAASNGDEEAASAIVEAFGLVGSEGMIVVEEGKGRGIELVHKTGMEIDRGCESLELLDDGGPRHLDVPLVALVDGEITTMSEVAPLLEEATQFPHPLVIVSRGCFGEAVKVLVANDRKLERADGRKFEVTAVRCPGHVDFMRSRLDDLAALTGATVVDPRVAPLSKFESWMLGSAQTVTVDKDSASFVAFEDKYPLIEERVAQLRREIDTTTSSHDVEELRTRIARLTDGLCVMRVGGWSDTEIRERRARIEDALGAVRVAVDGGVVPGGGIAYLALSVFLQLGVQFSRESPFCDSPIFAAWGLADEILVSALQEPLRTLARNAGHEPSVVLASVLAASREPGATGPAPSWEAGWDAMTGEIRDLRESPVLCDPLDVVKATVLTAISTASTLLSAEVALTHVQG
jgi:chaperonin GroEL